MLLFYNHTETVVCLFGATSQWEVTKSMLYSIITCDYDLLSSCAVVPNLKLLVTTAKRGSTKLQQDCKSIKDMLPALLQTVLAAWHGLTRKQAASATYLHIYTALLVGNFVFIMKYSMLALPASRCVIITSADLPACRGKSMLPVVVCMRSCWMHYLQKLTQSGSACAVCVNITVYQWKMLQLSSCTSCWCCIAEPT